VSYTPYQKSAASRASLMDPEVAGVACFEQVAKLKDRLPESVRKVGGGWGKWRAGRAWGAAVWSCLGGGGG
jgi:hypothetical protein